MPIRITPSDFASGGDSATVLNTSPNQDSKRDRIKVVVRLRPITAKTNKRNIIVLDEKTILLEEKGNFAEKNFSDFKQKKVYESDHFTFDAVFGEDASQEEVYNVTAKHLVNEMIAGYNGMIFAYGATGSGKTYTMMAMNYSVSNSTIEYSRCGIIVQTFKDLFSAIEKHRGKFIVTLSYMEIYNETIRDLFNTDGGYLELRGNGDVQVVGLTEMVTTSCHQAINLLKKGNDIRSVRYTGANSASSRSHAILIIVLRQTVEHQDYRTLQPSSRQSKLLFVDLAGSERAKYTQNKGKRLQEGGHINKSLLALGNCISALSHGTKAPHVNFRDSKLTRLLREPLSGNYRTIMIAQVNPASEYREDIKNTLNFASKAMGITKRLKPNAVYLGQQLPKYHQNLIGELHDEVARLKSKIKERSQESKVTSENYYKARKLRDEIIFVFEERMKLRQQLLDVDNHLLSLSDEAEKQQNIISYWQSKNSKLYYWRNSSIYESDENGDTGKRINEATLILNSFEKEQEELIKIRNDLIEKLEHMKEKAIDLENELANLDEDTEKELLRLFVRVHELEVDKLSLERERMLDAFELRRLKDSIVQYQDQQKISDDIITKQRQLIEENNIRVPVDLQALYRLYQEEIHITTLKNFKRESETDRLGLPVLIETDDDDVPTSNSRSRTKVLSSSLDLNDEYIEHNDKLPTRLPKVASSSMNNEDRVHFQNPSPVPAAVLFPPITF